MCCMFTTLVLFGPRLGILVWWLINPARFDLAFDDRWLLIILACADARRRAKIFGGNLPTGSGLCLQKVCLNRELLA